MFADRGVVAYLEKHHVRVELHHEKELSRILIAEMQMHDALLRQKRVEAPVPIFAVEARSERHPAHDMGSDLGQSRL